MGRVIYNPYNVDRIKTFVDINGNQSKEPISSLGQKTNSTTIRNNKGVVGSKAEGKGRNEEAETDKTK